MAYRLETRKTWSQTMRDLETCMNRWGIRPDRWQVECLVAGRARAEQYRPPQTEDERRVTVRLQRPDGSHLELTYDRQPRAVDNFRALYLTLEEIRLQELRGVMDLFRQAYAQLPPPRESTDGAVAEDPYDILGITRSAPLEVAEAAYRTLSKRAHPDAGGSTEAAARLNRAIEQIRELHRVRR